MVLSFVPAERSKGYGYWGYYQKHDQANGLARGAEPKPVQQGRGRRQSADGIVEALLDRLPFGGRQNHSSQHTLLGDKQE